jgi:hypothetical protein
MDHMSHMHSELIKAHRANLRRYCQLLAIDLTDQERDFIHRRVAETRLQLDRLQHLEDPQTSNTAGMSLCAA